MPPRAGRGCGTRPRRRPPTGRAEARRTRAAGPRPHGRRERDVPRQVFLDPAAREMYTDREAVAAEVVGCLRLDAGRHPDDGELSAPIGELSVKSEHFRRLWADHEVKERTQGVKRISQPTAGELTLPYETPTLPGDPDQPLVVCTPEPGSPTAERLSVPSWTASSPRE
ncbi:hypothetical protein [Streptomyces sp. NPDC008141]|uniref:MmyB family transcriptional regulator n=1 Tax=Streptomyces sp. NPDC008141 TaxID=3364815 RepID=UPI0036E5FD90